MANVSVYNIEGKEVGSIELNDAVFGVEVNEHLVHMAVVNQLANNRQGTQKAKTRSEVRGGGRKPWRQKGTGGTETSKYPEEKKETSISKVAASEMERGQTMVRAPWGSDRIIDSLILAERFWESLPERVKAP